MVVSAEARCDQPIFNEMPRWDNGWGFQIVRELRTERDLLDGETVVGRGFSEDVEILHLEGVYTWDKSVRMTVKIPYVVEARREQLDSGIKRVQHDNGIGDLTLAIPLKRYINADQRSTSWTFAPQFRIPLAGNDEYEVYDNEWGTGVSFGYETETYRYVAAVGVTAWSFFGNEPFEASASINLGFNIHHARSSGHLLWESDVHFEDDGSLTIAIGPAFYWRMTDTVHIRVSWKDDVSDRQGTVDHGNGDALTVGIGFVF